MAAVWQGCCEALGAALQLPTCWAAAVGRLLKILSRCCSLLRELQQSMHGWAKQLTAALLLQAFFRRRPECAVCGCVCVHEPRCLRIRFVSQVLPSKAAASC